MEKNYQNRFMCVEVIVCYIIVVFFETQCSMLLRERVGQCVPTALQNQASPTPVRWNSPLYKTLAKVMYEVNFEPSKLCNGSTNLARKLAERAIYFTFRNFFFFIMSKAISVSTGPIFTIFSTNGRYLREFS